MIQTLDQYLQQSPIGAADCICVLRNWDTEVTKERFERALTLFNHDYAPILLIARDGNTKEEAERLRDLAAKLGWRKFIIVTHGTHAVRAFLTFYKSLKDLWSADINRLRLYSAPVGLVITSPEEQAKIRAYAKDLAKPEEGVRYLEWLNSITANKPLHS